MTKDKERRGFPLGHSGTPSPEQAKHDYEPGETTGRSQSEPNCRICGNPKRNEVHS